MTTKQAIIAIHNASWIYAVIHIMKDDQVTVEISKEQAYEIVRGYENETRLLVKSVAEGNIIIIG